jgi:hypothetical protein
MRVVGVVGSEKATPSSPLPLPPPPARAAAGFTFVRESKFFPPRPLEPLSRDVTASHATMVAAEACYRRARGSEGQFYLDGRIGYCG